MPDREKVIKGIESCEPSISKRVCKNCPYREEMNCDYVLWNDALELLKESVPQGVVDQVRWERDTALSQLEQIGKGLGSKMDDIVSMLKEQELVRCKDCRKRITIYCPFYKKYKGTKYDDWFCADGVKKDD